MKILFIGDVVGKPGRQALALFLRKVQEAHDDPPTEAYEQYAAALRPLVGLAGGKVRTTADGVLAGFVT